MSDPTRRPAGTRHRRPHLLWATVAAAVLGGIIAVPAAAHPSGPPPVAELTAAGPELIVQWSAADDDYAALAVAADVLPADAAVGVADVQDGPVTLEPDQQKAAQASPALANYVADRVSVTQDGRACELHEVDTSTLFETGLTVRGVCPAALAEVEIEIALLTDLDPAYRTVAVASGPAMPQKTMYTADRDILHWEFGADGRPAIRWWMFAAVAVSSALVVVAAARLVRRWKGRT